MGYNQKEYEEKKRELSEKITELIDHDDQAALTKKEKKDKRNMDLRTKASIGSITNKLGMETMSYHFWLGFIVEHLMQVNTSDDIIRLYKKGLDLAVQIEGVLEKSTETINIEHIIASYTDEDIKDTLFLLFGEKVFHNKHITLNLHHSVIEAMKK